MQTQAFFFADDGDIPNNSLPLIAYRGALNPDAGDPADAFEALFASNRWPRLWRNGIYPFHHYHSSAHEVLGMAEGWAEVRFGGEGGETITLNAGDAVLIPAGVGHKRLSDSGRFLVIGGYPEGQVADLLRSGEPGGDAIRARIAAVPRPEADPVGGAAGPIAEIWARPA